MSNSVFLDVDSRIVENNLRITNNGPDDEFNKIFGNIGSEYPSKLVRPHPGLCVKTKERGADNKFFVNICTTDAIPPPKDISEAELVQLLESEDVPEFRVPMSIGEIRIEKDKKSADVKVCDIAINPAFFKKVEKIQAFKNFFMAVVFQGIENKHGIICEEDKRILTNKKCLGTLQSHRIQQREIAEKMGIPLENKPAMQGLTSEKNKENKVLIETISSKEFEAKVPEYRLFQKKNGSNCLTGEFKFPDIISASELTLDIGEDRILVESKNKGYLVDIFVPYCIRNQKCTSTFNNASKILTLNMPLIGG